MVALWALFISLGGLTAVSFCLVLGVSIFMGWETDDKFSAKMWSHFISYLFEDRWVLLIGEGGGEKGRDQATFVLVAMVGSWNFGSGICTALNGY